MPEVNFSIAGAGPVLHGLSPMVNFRVRISTAVPHQAIEALIVQSQIQWQPAGRSYSPAEKERLTELFGPPQDWGRTLRNRLWAHASTTTGAFAGSIEVNLAVPCTFDMNVAATKYFFALEANEIPLLFLFSGSIFYFSEGQLQVQPIAWDKEADYRMPVQVWRQALDSHYPNSAWILLQKDVFDRVAAFKRSMGALTWEETMEALLASKSGGSTTMGFPGASEPTVKDVTLHQEVSA